MTGAVIALNACADIQPNADPFAELRAQAEAPPAPLRSVGAGGGVWSEGAAGAGGRARGFIRRGAAPAAAGTAPPPGAATAASAGGGTVSLNFENADLREVVRAFLDDGLGLAYAIDPRVEGTVTIRTNTPLRDDQVLPVLEEILRLNDAALVDAGAILQIIPRSEAGLAAPALSARAAAARGLTLRVTPLRFADVADVRAVLEGFGPPDGLLSYDERRNVVYSLGTASEQETIAGLLRTLDTDRMAGRSVALLPLRFSDAVAAADELALIYEGDRRIRIAPVERLDALLIVADSPRLLDDALSLARSFDQIGAETPRVHVFAVQNRRAGDVAAVLGGVLGVEVTGAAQEGPSLAPGLAPRRDDEENGAADAPAAPRPAAATAAASPGNGVEGVLRLSVDPANNAIVAMATAASASRIAASIRRLDAQPRQLLLEATIAEVVLNDELEFGVRWFLQDGNFGGGFSDLASGAVGSVFPGFNAFFETGDARATLSALDAITDVRLLSSPSLLVLDNNAARLQVGDQVPITTRSSTSVTDPDAPIVSETEFRDTGVILDLLPRINPNGLVTITVRQEVSSVTENSDPDGNPTFSQRVVSSTVSVDSGDTVALAGLISSGAQRGRTGLPVLSNIPVAGGAFGVTELTADRTELIVLLTPRVVRDQRDARAATAELRDRLQGIFGPPPIVDPVTGPRRRALTP